MDPAWRNVLKTNTLYFRTELVGTLVQTIFGLGIPIEFVQKNASSKINTKTL